ncbi:acyl-CoA dehydrogenase family protein [Hydrocarboniphaga sp.]|uniref:acyl-CoA dehydrogenase family protein n=1 Tax=Hydrocarboniphaga sp. TaxID=2033016 RepID=UPI00262C0E64|nr:acyl-CoA dehydrogenase family protein [Hydrocarboniphaga sp.]
MELFRDSARKFFQQEIRPHSERWREANPIDREAYRKAGDMGLLCMWADEEYGGQGVQDFRYEQILIEENVFHGGAGYMDEYTICRLYQDERVHRILAGSSEIMKELIARSILD